MVKRQIINLHSLKLTLETEKGIIASQIKGLDAISPHDFKSASFGIPTSCDLCQTTIWGLAKQGFTCRACGYNCHSKCEMKVPTTCKADKPPPKSSKRSATPVSISTKTASSQGASIGAQRSARTTASDIATPVSSKTGSEAGQENAVEYVVLYDYDASAEEELTVRTGDRVYLLEPANANGWIKVSLNGQTGLVPSTYAEPAKKSPPVPRVSAQPSGKERQARVLYDYTKESDIELTIHEGDIITVLNTECGDGWWEGVLNGQRGQLPGSYVEFI